MPRNEEGEFELVLGNRQLLLVFMILLVLSAVFFTMGFLVGANWHTPDAIEMAQQPKDGGGLIRVEPAGPQSTRQAKPVPDEEGPVPARPGQSPAVPEQKGATAPGQVPPVGSPKAEPPRSDMPKAGTPGTEEVRTPPGLSGRPPQPGETYLQVAAVERAEAEMFAELLRKKGFNVVLGPGPGGALQRVLVGPLEPAALVKTRARLEEIGIRPFVRKF